MIEVVVVIGILVILAAIIVGSAGRMRARSNASSCIVKMKAIGQALKMYRLDEGAYPDWMFAGVADPNNPPIPQNNPDTLPPFDDPDADFDLPGVNSRPGPGLWALFSMGYLSSSRILICPQNPFAHAANETLISDERWGDLFEKLHGYENRDPLTGEWKYLPDRSLEGWAVDDPASPYYNRSLKALYPSDGTVVFWCPYHRKTYKRGRVGLDLVLFVDGHVEKRLMPMSPADKRAMLEPEE